MAGRRANRDEWQKRVERWTDSGLSAEQFAAETGINAGTLQFWKYKLRKQRGESPRRSTRNVPAPIVSSLVEVRPVSVAAADCRFEIELNNGRRLRLPATFDADAVKALVAVLEAAP
jgi:transposase-like protein